MSDEDIIELWKKGWSVDRIAHNFPSIRFREDKEPSWQMYNRVETVILEYQNEYGRKRNMNEELKKITSEMNNFSKKYNCIIKVYAIEAKKLGTKETSYIYKLSTEKEKFDVGDIVKGKTNYYLATNNKMTKGEVLESTNGKLKIKILEHENKEYINEIYEDLYEADFELVSCNEN